MPLDLSKLHPAARKAFIESGRKFGSKDTLAQADKTLNGLATHAAKLEDHGFGPDDVNDLKSAREGLIAAGVSREDKRVGNYSGRQVTCVGTLHVNVEKLDGETVSVFTMDVEQVEPK